MHNWNKKSGKAYITSGIGYGKTKLAAFDKAELDANIMSTNAIKVSSFVPPNWKIIKDNKDLKKLSDDGAFLPMAYAYEISNTEKVSASVIIGTNKDKSKASIITEHADIGISKEESLKDSESCLKEAFSFRNWRLDKMEKVATEAEPKDSLYVCALVAVLFFPDND
tara:strand:- start:213 stop:713 length:501 start_codon:yes stop_codon:yes gene_type:complete